MIQGGIQKVSANGIIGPDGVEREYDVISELREVLAEKT